jgi:hypothetical protein
MKFLFSLFLVGYIVSNMLQNRIYTDKICTEPYSHGLLNKINFCYYLPDHDASIKFQTNNTHVIETDCIGKDCRTDCKDKFSPVNFNRCVDLSPEYKEKGFYNYFYNKKLVIRGNYIPDGKHLYYTTYDENEHCLNNLESTYASIVINTCLNINFTQSLNFDLKLENFLNLFKFTKNLPQSIRVEHNQRDKLATVRGFEAKECRGQEIKVSVETDKCNVIEHFSIKVTAKI